VPLLIASQPADLTLPLPVPSPAGTVTAQSAFTETQPRMPVIPAPETIPAPAVTTTETVAEAPFPTIRWRESRALGVPHIGTLVDGVRLPQEGPDWVTWDPVRDRVPNRAVRLYGTDELVRMALDVIAAYRLAHPNASRVVVGDLSRRGGGEIDEHASHENGLDLDVYYPRTDGRELPPASVGQVDVRLAQDLLDRFVAAGASVVFVGYSVSLHGQAGVVVPYANHDNHMHVRIGAGGAVSGD
jgi:murein endopeptidase